MAVKCGSEPSGQSSNIESSGSAALKGTTSAKLLAFFVTIVIVIAVVLIAFLQLYSSSRVHISVIADTEKTVYASGEPINITIRLWNLTNRTVSLSFSDGLQVAYAVEDLSGKVLYKLWAHVATTPVFTTLTLGPGQYHQYNLTDTAAWSQVDDEGRPVKVPGSYVIIPSLSLTDKARVSLTPATVSIEPAN